MKDKHSFMLGFFIFMFLNILGYSLMPEGNFWLRICSGMTFLIASDVMNKAWKHWEKM